MPSLAFSRTSGVNGFSPSLLNACSLRPGGGLRGVDREAGAVAGRCNCLSASDRSTLTMCELK